jgi:hypothetical protein
MALLLLRVTVEVMTESGEDVVEVVAVKRS